MQAKSLSLLIYRLALATCAVGVGSIVIPDLVHITTKIPVSSSSFAQSVKKKRKSNKRRLKNRRKKQKQAHAHHDHSAHDHSSHDHSSHDHRKRRSMQHSAHRHKHDHHSPKRGFTMSAGAMAMMGFGGSTSESSNQESGDSHAGHDHSGHAHLMLNSADGHDHGSETEAASNSDSDSSSSSIGFLLNVSPGYQLNRNWALTSSFGLSKDGLNDPSAGLAYSLPVNRQLNTILNLSSTLPLSEASQDSGKITAVTAGVNPNFRYRKWTFSGSLSFTQNIYGKPLEQSENSNTTFADADDHDHEDDNEHALTQEEHDDEHHEDDHAEEGHSAGSGDTVATTNPWANSSGTPISSTTPSTHEDNDHDHGHENSTGNTASTEGNANSEHQHGSEAVAGTASGEGETAHLEASPADRANNAIASTFAVGYQVLTALQAGAGIALTRANSELGDVTYTTEAKLVQATYTLKSWNVGGWLSLTKTGKGITAPSDPGAGLSLGYTL